MTQAEDDAGRLLRLLDEHDDPDGFFTGRQLQEAMELDEKRAGTCIKMLQAAGYLRIEAALYGDGPSWAINLYQITSSAAMGLNCYNKGESPFINPSMNHHTGDKFYTTMGNVSGSAIAFGSHAQATYAPGIDAGVFNSKMAELQALLQQLPEAEREDGEHQLEALTRAAQQGPEAMEKRAGSFYRYLQAIWEGTGNAATGVFMYHAAAALFVHAGVTFPALPPGL